MRINVYLDGKLKTNDIDNIDRIVYLTTNNILLDKTKYIKCGTLLDLNKEEHNIYFESESY